MVEPRREMIVPTTGAAAPAVVKVIERSFSRLRVQVLTTLPERHEVDVEYAISGSARVRLDGKPLAELRVIVRDQVVNVPLGGKPSQTLSVRFAGVVRPRLDIRLNGALITGLL